MRNTGSPRAIAVGAIVCALSCVASVHAQPAKPPSEYQVKAAYLYNFAKFIQWPTGVPSNRPDAFAICVLGGDPFGPFLDTLSSSGGIDGKPVVTKRLTKRQDAPGCAVLFIGASEADHLTDILPAIDKGVLTVSDIPGFADHGGMIQFVAEGTRIRFEVNQTAAERAGLMLSSELLKVAVTVRKSPAD